MLEKNPTYFYDLRRVVYGMSVVRGKFILSTTKGHLMIEYNFEVCFICHYPTTDWSEMPDGEKHCSLCVAEAAEQYAEQVALFEAMEQDWTSEDLAEMYHDMA
jgi:hypothetical protein